MYFYLLNTRLRCPTALYYYFLFFKEVQTYMSQTQLFVHPSFLLFLSLPFPVNYKPIFISVYAKALAITIIFYFSHLSSRQLELFTKYLLDISTATTLGPGTVVFNLNYCYKLLIVFFNDSCFAALFYSYKSSHYDPLNTWNVVV